MDLDYIGKIFISGFTLYTFALIIYRLAFHPLRSIPGPLLAKVTYGYQMYYDVYLGGVMPSHLAKLHQKYGLIVRIAPDRVHVNDPEFYKRLFGPREDFVKAKYYYGNLGITESIVTIQDAKAHRVLRNYLNPFFTPQAALAQRPLVFDGIKKLLHTLGETEEFPIDIQRTLGQFFVNLTCQTIFGLHDMSHEDTLTIFDGISGWFSSFNIALAFPIIPAIALKLPDWLTTRLVPGYLCILQNVRICVEQCKAKVKGSEPFTQYENVFDMLQVSEVGGHQLNETQILHEAIELLAGGVLPTNTVLVTLRSELAGLQKTAEGIPTCDFSTDAPYLTAIVKETLRLRPAVGPGFLPRVVPSQGIFIGEKFVPGGTKISTSIFSVNTNSALFKDPTSFDPNRWLGSKSNELEDWFISFSKGPRMCLGKHMAMLSISSVLAAIFSKFDLTLHKTDVDTMDWRDQTLLVNKSHIMAFVTPLESPSPETDSLLINDLDTVILPDLFVSWASTPIKLNPNYTVVAPEAENWFKKICKHDENTHEKYLKADFGYFAGTCRHQMPKHQNIAPLLITATGYGHLMIKSTKGIQRRFRQHQKDYLYQVLEQSNPEIIETYTDLETFVANHRESVGAKPLLPLIEYCYGLDIPEFIFDDPAIQRIIDLQAELILLANDVYSYAREAKVKHQHNIIHILRKRGMTQQEALNHTGEAIFSRYKEWDSVVEEIPSWGEETDSVVKRYVEISRITVISNLDWSFKSQRYFGNQHEVVRKTRCVPAIPFAE